MNGVGEQAFDLSQLDAIQKAAEHQARQFAAQLIAAVNQGLGTSVSQLTGDIEHLMKYLMGDVAPGK